MGYRFLGSESFIYNPCQGSHTMRFLCQRSHTSPGLLLLLFSQGGEEATCTTEPRVSLRKRSPASEGYKRVQYKCKGGKKSPENKYNEGELLLPCVVSSSSSSRRWRSHHHVPDPAGRGRKVSF